MKKPNVVCPAAKDLCRQESTGNYVVVCGIVYQQFVNGQSNFESFTIVPSNCEDDRYTKCHVWREEKDKDWMQKLGQKYSSLEQMEKINV